MKKLSDILYSLCAQKRPFAAEVADGALKITMMDEKIQTAYIPNEMADVIFKMYHTILGIPLLAPKQAETTNNMQADSNMQTETDDEYNEERLYYTEEEWDSGFYEDCDGRIHMR